MNDTRRTAILCLILALGTLMLYLPTVKHGLINLDDQLYLGNKHVLDGFDVQDIPWAFTNFDAANWHPLTWISHLIDVKLFQFNYGAHHLVNVLFHIANALLLFLLLLRMTKQLGPSFVVAVLFAIHPTHVESVAWLSERKDVLSTFFGLLAIGAYHAWTNQPSARRYVALLILFACSLMAKPMLVTLPCALLLLDYWPLGRMSDESDQVRQFGRLVYEKLPLFAMSAAVCIVTMYAQRAGDATVSTAVLPLTMRLGNAALSYITYLGVTFAPLGLAPVYPHPGNALALWIVFPACAMLILVTTGIVVLARRAPYLIVGWLWFLGTLVPVIGLVQVGNQATADRYTYVPHIGLFIIIAWGAPALLRGVSEPTRRRALATAFAAVVVVFSMLTWRQISYWENSIKLFEHTVSVTQRNAPAHLYLGMAYHAEKRTQEAVEQYAQCIQITPWSVNAHVNLGSIVLLWGELDRAREHLEKAIELDPTVELAHRNLGIALLQQKKPLEAVEQFTKALELKPEIADTHFLLAMAYEGAGQPEEALNQARILTEILPDNEGAKNLLERLSKTGD